MQSLAAAINAIVSGVNYRLVPEHKFPTAVEDSYAAFLWVANNIKSYNGNPAKIAVIGDSAGGNLAAETAILARDKGGPRITYQVLIYPTTDLGLTSNCLNELSEGYILSRRYAECCILVVEYEELNLQPGLDTHSNTLLQLDCCS